MDSLIRRFNAVRNDDLMLCQDRGVAYQRRMNEGRVSYDGEYLATFESEAYTQSKIAKAVNAGRCEFVKRHLVEGYSLLDVGAASGAFLRLAIDAGYKAKGFDIIPQTVVRLESQGLFASDASPFDAVTMWDSIEHMENPGVFLCRVRKGALLFVSVPVFEDLIYIRKSKHYKPGEHFYYWTVNGFIDYMEMYGFRLMEQSTHETDAGRDSIGAFAFVRDLPDRRDYVAAYQEMHSTRHYGSSATGLHLEMVASVVTMMQPNSILDYGCGRSDLVAHFWLDGKRKIARYDPAIPLYRHMPMGRFDMALVCDVMEHIPMLNVDRVLSEIKSKSHLALFTISTKLARAKLPNGRNAHCTLLTQSEWARWIGDVFGAVKVMPSTLDHELILLAGVAAEKREAA